MPRDPLLQPQNTLNPKPFRRGEENRVNVLNVPLTRGWPKCGKRRPVDLRSAQGNADVDRLHGRGATAPAAVFFLKGE